MGSTSPEVSHACRVLFGARAQQPGFAAEVTLEMVRQAYRSAVFRVHPDRAVEQGALRLTQSLNDAYGILKFWLRRPTPVIRNRVTSLRRSEGYCGIVFILSRWSLSRNFRVGDATAHATRLKGS